MSRPGLQFHTYINIHVNQQHSHDLLWIMISMRGAKPTRETCSHHLSQWGFCFPSRQARLHTRALPCNVSGINQYTPWWIRLPNSTAYMWSEIPKVHWTHPCVYRSFSISSYRHYSISIKRKLIYWSHWTMSFWITIYLTFFLLNAGLSFKTVPYCPKSDAAEYNKAK